MRLRVAAGSPAALKVVAAAHCAGAPVQLCWAEPGGEAFPGAVGGGGEAFPGPLGLRGPPPLTGAPSRRAAAVPAVSPMVPRPAAGERRGALLPQCHLPVSPGLSVRPPPSPPPFPLSVPLSRRYFFLRRGEQPTDLTTQWLEWEATELQVRAGRRGGAAVRHGRDRPSARSLPRWRPCMPTWCTAERAWRRWGNRWATSSGAWWGEARRTWPG